MACRPTETTRWPSADAPLPLLVTTPAAKTTISAAWWRAREKQRRLKRDRVNRLEFFLVLVVRARSVVSVPRPVVRMDGDLGDAWRGVSQRRIWWKGGALQPDEGSKDGAGERGGPARRGEGGAGGAGGAGGSGGGVSPRRPVHDRRSAATGTIRDERSEKRQETGGGCRGPSTVTRLPSSWWHHISANPAGFEDNKRKQKHAYASDDNLSEAGANSGTAVPKCKCKCRSSPRP